MRGPPLRRGGHKPRASEPLVYYCFECIQFLVQCPFDGIQWGMQVGLISRLRSQRCGCLSASTYVPPTYSIVFCRALEIALYELAPAQTNSLLLLDTCHCSHGGVC